jgi:hypothetical protein
MAVSNDNNEPARGRRQTGPGLSLVGGPIGLRQASHRFERQPRHVVAATINTQVGTLDSDSSSLMQQRLTIPLLPGASLRGGELMIPRAYNTLSSTGLRHRRGQGPFEDHNILVAISLVVVVMQLNIALFAWCEWRPSESRAPLPDPHRMRRLTSMAVYGREKGWDTGASCRQPRDASYSLGTPRQCCVAS